MLRRMGWEPTALQRMGAGIAFSGLSWIAAGAMQLKVGETRVTAEGLQQLRQALSQCKIEH